MTKYRCFSCRAECDWTCFCTKCIALELAILDDVIQDRLEGDYIEQETRSKNDKEGPFYQIRTISDRTPDQAK